MTATTDRVAEYTATIAEAAIGPADLVGMYATVVGMISAYAHPDLGIESDAERLARIRDVLAALDAARAAQSTR